MQFVKEATGRGEILSIPVRFKSYEFQSVIENGGTAVVCSVIDVNTNERFAAKVMQRPETGTDALRFLERELRLCVTLVCPYLVNCHDVVYMNDLIIVIMEHCESGDLLTVLTEETGQVMDDWQKIFVQICLGVQYMHGRGIAHRDLKLENVVVDKELNCKLCDFGALCEAPPAAVSTTICGTLSYKSPEQIRGNGYSARECDVWALGIMLYALSTGRLPWTSDSIAGIESEILEGVEDVEMLTDHQKEMVLGCCNIDRERRLKIDEVVAMAMKNLPSEMECLIRKCVQNSVQKKVARVTPSSVVIRPNVQQARGGGARKIVMGRTRSVGRPPLFYMRGNRVT